jgi:hypothetical protein
MFMEKKSYDYLNGFADALLISKAILMQENISKEEYLDKFLPMTIEKVNRLKLADLISDITL